MADMKLELPVDSKDVTDAITAGVMNALSDENFGALYLSAVARGAHTAMCRVCLSPALGRCDAVGRL